MSGKVSVGMGGEPVALISRLGWDFSGTVQEYLKGAERERDVSLLNATHASLIDSKISNLDN